MSSPLPPLFPANLRRWRESGQPRRWVESRQGRWNHADWLALLDSLKNSEFGWMESDAIGRVLDELKLQHANLVRWRSANEARTWVENQRGVWSYHEFLDLTDRLRKTEYWPLDQEMLRETLEEVRLEWQNFRRWCDSGDPQRWVEAHARGWNHADWIFLVDSLEQSQYWPMNLNEIGQFLEKYRGESHNLQRWIQADNAWSWVEDHQGVWNHHDWLGLLEVMRLDGYWPLDSLALGQVLEVTKSGWSKLRNWVDSGQALTWVESHHGAWNQDDWLALQSALDALGYKPLPSTALSQVLDDTRKQYLSRQPAYRPTWNDVLSPWGLPLTSPSTDRRRAA